MAAKKWFVLVGEEEQGPLGPRGLRRMAQRGELPQEAQVRREDWAEFRSVHDVQGLMGLGRPRSPRPPKVHGPYVPLRPLGWSTAAAMVAFAGLGVYGAGAAWRQSVAAARALEGAPLDTATAAMPLFGVGVWAVLALVAVGGLFVWWLWTARVNLPNLILAHAHYAPSWAIAAWFTPVLNCFRPFTVVEETDQLSAEADADGDTRVKANYGLLVPWWVSATVGTVLAIVYWSVDRSDAAAVRLAAFLHFATAVCAVLAGVLSAWVAIRVTEHQERAHQRHPDPVTPFRTDRLRKAKALRVVAS